MLVSRYLSGGLVGRHPGIPGGLVQVVHRERATCLLVRLANRECLLDVVSKIIFRLTGVM